VETSGELPIGVALASVLSARLDGAARPALLAAVTRLPRPRPAPAELSPRAGLSPPGELAPQRQLSPRGELSPPRY
jgi:hypothetical protein